MCELICYVNYTRRYIHEFLVRRSIPALAHAGRVPGARMSRLILNALDAQGRFVQLAAGYDPALNVHFLDVFDLRHENADPSYDSMFEHPAGRSTYGLTELAADVERLFGYALPFLISRVEKSPPGQFVEHLGRLDMD